MFLKLALLLKSVWTLVRGFCLSRHVWDFLVVMCETIRGYFEKNDIDSLDFFQAVESFAQDGLFRSMSTPYHSILGVCRLHFLSSM